LTVTALLLFFLPLELFSLFGAWPAKERYVGVVVASGCEVVFSGTDVVSGNVGSGRVGVVLTTVWVLVVSTSGCGDLEFVIGMLVSVHIYGDGVGGVMAPFGKDSDVL
jgi:quinol-cytochrome oxidoreductase complex cytochrome b subunit